MSLHQTKGKKKKVISKSKTSTKKPLRAPDPSSSSGGILGETIEEDVESVVSVLGSRESEGEDDGDLNSTGTQGNQVTWTFNVGGGTSPNFTNTTQLLGAVSINFLGDYIRDLIEVTMQMKDAMEQMKNALQERGDLPEELGPEVPEVLHSDSSERSRTKKKGGAAKKTTTKAAAPKKAQKGGKKKGGKKRGKK
ncbi:hypothetical protein TrRE_jg12102 [Triparma retinervis]|uniref:Uncharacterized protein n=1 Tax=Triparma retinervis TaxID=2557542 RepID=A0A9W6ZFM2_9STRA|nr:hypothetical protein TrRE_jg12102 [Triparma retinervis]